MLVVAGILCFICLIISIRLFSARNLTAGGNLFAVTFGFVFMLLFILSGSFIANSINNNLLEPELYRAEKIMNTCEETYNIFIKTDMSQDIIEAQKSYLDASIECYNSLLEEKKSFGKYKQDLKKYVEYHLIKYDNTVDN